MMQDAASAVKHVEAHNRVCGTIEASLFVCVCFSKLLIRMGVTGIFN